MSFLLSVNDTLYQEAEAHGSLLYRSAAQQIEYWAKLGKRIEEDASTSDLQALLAGIANIQFEIPPMKAIEPMSVMTDVDQKISAGQFSQSITRHSLYYEASKERPGLLDQVMPDGTRKTGHFKNGEFIIE